MGLQKRCFLSLTKYGVSENLVKLGPEFLHCLFFFFFTERVSLCGSVWLGTCYVK